MNLKVIGSSSQGNGYVVENDNEALVIEAGVSPSLIKQVLDWDTSKVCGVIVSHAHGDHSKYIRDYTRMGINVYTNQHVADTYNLNCHRTNIIKSKKAYKIGGFTIKPFDLVHDVPNHGFLIRHPETGLFPFITDTHYVQYTFLGMENIIIETNYDEEIIEEMVFSGKTSTLVYNRVLYSHISLQTVLRFLSANDLSRVNNIILTHLSTYHSDGPMFAQKVEEHTGKKTFIATKGAVIPLKKHS